MSLAHSPRIITDGLVLCYDMSNTQKSFKGQPTNNLIVTRPISLSIYAYVDGPVSVTSTDSSNSSRTVNRYTINSTAGTQRAAIRPSGLTTGVTYCFSFMMKNMTSGIIYADASKGYPEGGSNNNSLSLSEVTTTDMGNGWTYVKYRFSFSATPTNSAILSYGVTGGTVGQYFDIYNEQLEINTFPTPYVNGSRTSTQAVIDLSGKTTLTANSLTYNSNNTFTFDGSTNYLSTGALAGSFSQFTVSVWFNSGSVANYRNPIDCNYGVYAQQGNAGPRLEQNSAGSLIWMVGGSTTNNSAYDPYTLVGSGLQQNVWYNAVITRNNSSLISTYLNGTAVSTDAANPNGFVGTFGNVTIGRGFSLGGAAERSFVGQIPMVQIYNRALTTSEVQQNFNALKGRFGL